MNREPSFNFKIYLVKYNRVNCCIFLFALFLLASCSVQQKLSKAAKNDVLNSPALINAHTGISVYEPATGKYWFNFQGDKYFVPASNTKIPTCYAAMKYLGDSLPALMITETNDELILTGTGDPTLLHPDYDRQPVLEYLKTATKRIVATAPNWKDAGWGSGWTWGDYNEYYMAERSALPIYGNLLNFSGNENALQVVPAGVADINPTVNSKNNFANDVSRELGSNRFNLTYSGTALKQLSVPFITSPALAFRLLADTLHTTIQFRESNSMAGGNRRILHSQPLDSMLSPMMHRSDNFFAEQSLLMVSNMLLGKMNDHAIIDTLLKTDFAGLPQKPRWADGSGLSRYNLFTPQDFVAIFHKMMDDFGMERIKKILPTGGTGTLSSFYKAEQGCIFVKTGTLSGVVALSGFLLTKKNKQLIFSVLVNNHNAASSTEVRRAVEKFIERIRNEY